MMLRPPLVYPGMTSPIYTPVPGHLSQNSFIARPNDRPYYPSPVARLHNISLDSSTYSLHSAYASVPSKLRPSVAMQPTYMDPSRGMRQIVYANSSTSHATYSDEELEDDASVLLSTSMVDTAHRILGALDFQSVDEADNESMKAPSLCLTPRFLASKKRLEDQDGLECDDDIQIMAQSDDSLQQILEQSNGSLLKRTSAADNATASDAKDDEVERHRRMGERSSNVNRNFTKEFEKYDANKNVQVNAVHETAIGSTGQLFSQVAEEGDASTPKNREYSLVKWSLRPVANMRCVIVEGMLTGAGTDVLWRSTAIKKNLNKRTLQTGSGSVYKLVGPMDEESAASFGFTAGLCKAFKYGFPKNWEELIDNHFNSKEETKRKSSEKRTKNRSRLQPEIKNGPTPGECFDLALCPRTRSGRLVVPSGAVAWWKGVRLYTTPKTPLEIRVDTPIENQLDSPMAWPLTARRPDSRARSRKTPDSQAPSRKTSNSRAPSRKTLNSQAPSRKTPNSQAPSRKTPKTGQNSSKSKSNTDRTILKSAECDETKRVAIKQPAPSTVKSAQLARSRNSESTVSEKAKRPIRRKVATARDRPKKIEASESIIEIPDSGKKSSPPVRSSLVKSPYSYPAHRAGSASRSSSSNNRFRQLFDDKLDSVKTVGSDSVVNEREASERRDINRCSDSLPNRNEKGAVNRLANVQKKTSTSKTGKVDSDSEGNNRRTRSRGLQEDKVCMSPYVMLYDVRPRRNDLTDSKSDRSLPQPAQNEPIDEEMPIRRLRPRKARPLPSSSDESESELVASNKRQVRKKKPDKSRGNDSSVETHSSQGSRNAETQTRSRSKTGTKATNRTTETDRNNVQNVQVVKTKGNTVSKPQKIPKTAQKAADYHDDSDTDEEIYAARTRIKQTQEQVNKTINKSLGLNRSAKRLRKRLNSNAPVTVDALNEFGEKETTTWTVDEIQRFHRAMNTLPASTENYWYEIAALTWTKNEDQCRAFHLRDLPQSVKKPKVVNKPVMPKLIQLEGSDTVRVELSGGKGTFKRKKQMQNLLDQMNQDFDNDYFDSTPWSRKQRKILLPELGGETPLPKFCAENTPRTRLALQPRSERKTPVSSYISPGMNDGDKDDLYIHRCVQQLRGKIGRTQMNKTPKPKATHNLERETTILMQLSQNVNESYGDSDEQQDYYFSDNDGDQNLPSFR